jgi:hypothetical protein
VASRAEVVRRLECPFSSNSTILNLSTSSPLSTRLRPRSGRRELDALCHKATFAPAPKGGSLDHLVGASEKRWRDGESERTSGLEVDQIGDITYSIASSARARSAMVQASPTTKAIAAWCGGATTTESIVPLDEVPLSRPEVVVLLAEPTARRAATVTIAARQAAADGCAGRRRTLL